MTLAATPALARLAVRRDRLMIPAWVYLLTALVAGTAYSFKALFKTLAARDVFVATAGRNPAFEFLYGHLYGSSVGALTAWRYGVYAALGAALMSTFLVVRHTRADEETGRLELIGSAPVGRRAPLAAALAVAVTANAALAGLLAAALIALGLPPGGSAALALAIGATGLAFAAVAACAAQLAGTARSARGLVLAVLGIGYLLQATGNTAGARGPSWLTWISPLGWPGEVRAFAGQRWWVLALPLGTALAATAAAFVLAGRRDLGAGLLPGRPGPPAAGRWLRGPFGLAWRLQRGALTAWTAGLLAGWTASGAAGKGISALVSSSSGVRQAFARLGGQAAITNAFLAAIMSLAGLAAAGFATSAVLRLRSEEAAGHAELLLAGPVSRVRWWASHVCIAAAGAAVVLAAAGAGAGLGYGLRAGDAGHEVPLLLGAAMAQLPAVLLVAAAAVLLTGLVPGMAVGGSWAALAMAVLFFLLGELLRLSHWIVDLSPFTHVPKLPGGTLRSQPLIWLSVIAVAVVVAGLAGLRRRDIA